MNGWNNRRKTVWTSIGSLVGHLLASTITFVVLFTLGWALSWYLGSLEKLHAFEPESVARLERYWFGADVLLCGAATVASIFRFIRDLLEG